MSGQQQQSPDATVIDTATDTETTATGTETTITDTRTEETTNTGTEETTVTTDTGTTVDTEITTTVQLTEQQYNDLIATAKDSNMIESALLTVLIGLLIGYIGVRGLFDAWRS